MSISTNSNDDSTNNNTLSVGSTLLPVDFVPGDDTVIIGRGRKIKRHEGNQRLNRLVEQQLQAYTLAENKTHKSAILVRVLNQVREKNVDRVGFVKQDGSTGRWYCVSMSAARANVAQAFRDADHLHYRSSRQSKQRRRKQEKLEDDDVVASPGDASPETTACAMPSLAGEMNLKNKQGFSLTSAVMQGIVHPSMDNNSGNMMASSAAMLQRVPMPSLAPNNNNNNMAVPPFGGVANQAQNALAAAFGGDAPAPVDRSRARLCNILDEAVRASEDLDEFMPGNGSNVNETLNLCDWNEGEEDPFEPVPLEEEQQAAAMAATQMATRRHSLSFPDMMPRRNSAFGNGNVNVNCGMSGGNQTIADMYMNSQQQQQRQRMMMMMQGGNSNAMNMNNMMLPPGNMNMLPQGCNMNMNNMGMNMGMNMNMNMAMMQQQQRNMGMFQ